MGSNSTIARSSGLPSSVTTPRTLVSPLPQPDPATTIPASTIQARLRPSLPTVGSISILPDRLPIVAAAQVLVSLVVDVRDGGTGGVAADETVPAGGR